MPPRRPNQRRSRDRRDDGYDEEEAVHWGLRRDARSISWEYRDSSSLTPLLFMQREAYYYLAESMMERGVFLAHIVAPLSMLYRHYNTILHRLQNSSAAALMARLIARIRLLTKWCMDLLERLSFLMTWVISYGELALLYVEDLSIYVRRRHRFGPKRYRTINEITRRDCYEYFGINNGDLRLLYRHWRIPDQFTSPHRHVFTGEECFIIQVWVNVPS